MILSSMDGTKLSYSLALAIGTGTTLLIAWYWWSSKGKKNQLPTKWYKVGTLSDILIYPVKSLGFIRVNSIECTILGCKSGWLRDRTLMLIDLNEKFITARKYPHMVLIKPSIAGSVLTLSATGMTAIDIDLANVGKSLQAEIWGQQVPAFDCGDEVAQWLSKFILHEDTGIRLVYYPLDKSSREPKLKCFPLIENTDVGAYPDETSFTLMNEASIADLNSNLDDPVTPLNFRMNFTIKGGQSFEEDTWDWVKIGSVVFRKVRPCTRCILTTIDPEAGVKNSKMEPLTTLKKYRQIEDAEIRRSVGESPALGIHLALRGSNGIVELNDPVYVGVLDIDTNNS